MELSIFHPLNSTVCRFPGSSFFTCSLQFTACIPLFHHILQRVKHPLCGLAENRVLRFSRTCGKKCDKEESDVTRKEKLRRLLTGVFWISLVCSLVFTWFYMNRAIPDKLNLVVDETESFHFPLPVKVTLESESEEVVVGNGSNIPSDQIHLQINKPFSLYSSNEGTYHLNLKLFGIIDFKDIEVDVSDTKYAIPCGMPVGIYMKSDGLMVIGTGQVETKDGSTIDPAEGVLKSGDYIEAINGEPADDKDDMIEAVANAKGSPIKLDVRRDNQTMEVTMTPVETKDGDYKLGIWIRDDTQGIGTMTYVTQSGEYGALGHGISDSDTGLLVSTSGGELYDTEIMGIEKGSMGKPGVLSGVIYYGGQSKLGTIEANTEQGIFGTIDSRMWKEIDKMLGEGPGREPIPIGYRQDVIKGPAFIRSCISGEPRDYAIEIQKVDYSTAHKNKSLVIKVTDPELLSLTGGIVQGMSGSPIIQDGKLIGAVTHVFIQDSTKGYGIFIENMLEH